MTGNALAPKLSGAQLSEWSRSMQRPKIQPHNSSQHLWHVTFGVKFTSVLSGSNDLACAVRFLDTESNEIPQKAVLIFKGNC